MFENLRGDIEQYSRFGRWYTRLGFWVTASYRLGAWADRLPSGAGRNVAVLVSNAISAPVRVLKDVHLPGSARIGPGLVILHPHAIFVPPGAEIGSNCQLFQDVTLGQGPIPGLPRLGKNVTVYAGARVLGGIQVGDEVEIGANAVVTRDVPGGSMVAAPASRSIPRETVQVISSPEARAYAAASSRPKPGSDG